MQNIANQICDSVAHNVSPSVAQNIVQIVAYNTHYSAVHDSTIRFRYSVVHDCEQVPDHSLAHRDNVGNTRKNVAHDVYDDLHNAVHGVMYSVQKRGLSDSQNMAYKVIPSCAKYRLYKQDNVLFTMLRKLLFKTICTLLFKMLHTTLCKLLLK